VEVDAENGSQHDDDDAQCTGAQQYPGEDCQAAGELRETHQITGDERNVLIVGEVLRAGAGERSEQNLTAVVENRESASDAHEKQREIVGGSGAVAVGHKILRGTI